MDEKRSDGMKIREKPAIDWKVPPNPHRGEELIKNLAVASALVLCAIALKRGAVPGAEDFTDAVVASVTDETLLDDRLGKLSFVSTLFPEATLVFGESNDAELTLPVHGGMVVHAWNQEEPYMTWRTENPRVMSMSDGVVMGVYHGENEERLVQIMGENGLSCIYGNLKDAAVQTGERVDAGKVLGTLMEGSDFVLEVRRNGVSVDPASFLGSAS